MWKAGDDGAHNLLLVREFHEICEYLNREEALPLSRALPGMTKIFFFLGRRILSLIVPGNSYHVPPRTYV